MRNIIKEIKNTNVLLEIKKKILIIQMTQVICSRLLLEIKERIMILMNLETMTLNKVLKD